jgi:hypothetical protein
MAQWIRCERDFLEEDTVIRFLEAVWDNRQPRKKGQGGKRLGEREITGEVVGPAERDGHLAVKVLSSRVTEDLFGRHLVHPARPGTVVLVSIERMLSAYGRAERRGLERRGGAHCRPAQQARGGRYGDGSRPRVRPGPRSGAVSRSFRTARSA